jgi:hypothetical protein
VYFRKTYQISLLTLCLLTISTAVNCQLPAKEANQVGYKTEYYGGINLHSSGWGGTFNYAKFATYKSYHLFNLDVVSLKHRKEVKSKGFLDEKAREYVYGKLNNFFTIRAGYGKKLIFASKSREKGVQVSFNYVIGPSLGFSRPVYLEVLQVDMMGRIIPTIERYNPEQHNITNIYGRARGQFRFSELKLHPGAYIKGGIEFEYGEMREFIRAIEVGICMDAYLQRIPIMTGINNPFLFPAVYLNLHIGSRDF